MQVTTAPSTRPKKGERLNSLDALRGFSMFWLLGGATLLRFLFKDAEEGSSAWHLAQQFQHVEWDGFRFYDFIFPLFLFCIGVAVPISVEKRLSLGDSKRKILIQTLTRLWWMVFLGWWINGNLLTWEPSKFALSYSVLMMLGLGYFMAVVLVLYTSTRTQILITAGTLLAYWAVQMGISVPGREPGTFERNLIFSDWLYNETIGKLGAPWKSRYGQGFIISMWNHGATAMLGVFASRILTSDRTSIQRIKTLLLGAGIFLILGYVWSLHLPIVKNRWTSSYVLWCGGWSWGLMALFYWIIDIKGFTRWAFLFLALGANSILAYLIANLFMGPFRSLATTLFNGLSLYVSPSTFAFLMLLIPYGMAWSLLIWMRKNKLFLKL